MKERGFRIGLPNRGKLNNVCRRIFTDNLSMLPESGVDNRRYFQVSKDSTVEFIFARSTNLPFLLSQKIVDVAITGKDYVQESGEKLIELMDLEICPGKVCILVPQDSSIGEVADLEGLTIATQLPNIANDWIRSVGLETTKILSIDGACEVYPYLNLAHATLDVVATGKTARANNLLPFLEIFYTSGRMYSSQTTYDENRQKVDSIIDLLKQKYSSL